MVSNNLFVLVMGLFLPWDSNVMSKHAPVFLFDNKTVNCFPGLS